MPVFMTEFSELHDASSKPWIQLSSFTALVFLLLTQNCSGRPQMVGPSQPVLALVGDDVILSCQLEPAIDASGMSIEWSREGLDPSDVYEWSGEVELESSKHPDYKGRTSLAVYKLKFGDVSLKLSKVKPSDKGKYECYIRTLGRGFTVQLVVGGVSFPVISLAGLGRTSSSVELQCESAGWYPEPEVLWLDADGNLLSAGPTETVRGPDDLYTVSSRVTVENKHGNKFTCRVQQKNINQNREALIQVTDDFFNVQSSNISIILTLAVGFTVAFILIIVLLVHTGRQNRKRKNENQDEPEQLQLKTNHSETKNLLQPEKEKNDLQENHLKKEERAGPLTVEEIIGTGRYIRVKNVSSEEINLEGWKLQLQISINDSSTHRIDESLKLKAGRMLCIWNRDWGINHPDDVDLEWSDEKWNPEVKLQMNLISNDGETFELL